MKPINCQQTGFSLIEIAMSLIIIGVLLSGIASPISEGFKSAQMRKNLNRINTAREAIVGFVIQNQRLPCPAKAWEDSTTNAHEGIEACDSDLGTSAKNACNGGDLTSKKTCSGYLPWKTLGVQRFDSWENPLFYSVDRRLTRKESFQKIAHDNENLKSIEMKGRIQESYAKYAEYTIADNIAAVLGSFGRHNISFNASNGTIAVPAASNNTDEAENIRSCCTILPLNNDNSKMIFYQRIENSEENTVDHTGKLIGSFDDQIVWIPFYQLLGVMAKTDRLYLSDGD